MRAFWNPVALGHAPRFFVQRGQLRANFEIAARAEALLEGCRSVGLALECPDPADAKAMAAVHSTDYIDFLEHGYAAWQAEAGAGPEIVATSHPPRAARLTSPPASILGRAGWFMADAACPIGARTWAAVAAAAGSALAAAEATAGGESAYALARPPGHHAYPAQAGGHCYINNAALAAERMRALGAARVAVLDIDSHHGNGTQGIFWHRDDVLFVSVHGDPDHYYPWFTGRGHEQGEGAGAGYTLNLPLALGTDDGGWLDAIAHGLARIRAFGADALVVSLGFDASKDEPLNAFGVTECGFARAGGAIGAFGRPTAIIQEGGYNVALLSTLLARFLTGFGGG